jgi:hypothetical protein
MTMAKRKKDDPSEARAEEARYAETTRLLEERIAYHRAKLSEERERAERPRRLRFWRYWRTET